MPTTAIKNIAYRALLPFCAPSCGSHPIQSVTGHELKEQHLFEKLIRRHHVLGSAVLIASSGQMSLICTSSENPKHRASPDTYFRVASITKTATAVLCMRLADRGLLDLDCPVNELFHDTDVGSTLKGITLSHLLSHTSGVIDPPGLESYLEQDIPFADFLPSALQGEPGQAFHYSNLGFGLIGCVLEAVFNMPVGLLFEQQLFTPLHMNATLEGCRLPFSQIMPVTRILPYRQNSDTVLTKLGSKPLDKPDPLRHYGHTAGSMYTDILSLNRLLQIIVNHHSDGFLSDHILRKMKSKQASYGNISPTLSYGYGLLRIEDRQISDSLILGHQGFAYGCADGAFWEEKTGRTMIMLNGGCSEARKGRLGLLNRDLLYWAFQKELLQW